MTAYTAPQPEPKTFTPVVRSTPRPGEWVEDRKTRRFVQVKGKDSM